MGNTSIAPPSGIVVPVRSKLTVLRYWGTTICSFSTLIIGIAGFAASLLYALSGTDPSQIKAAVSILGSLGMSGLGGFLVRLDSIAREAVRWEQARDALMAMPDDFPQKNELIAGYFRRQLDLKPVTPRSKSVVKER